MRPRSPHALVQVGGYALALSVALAGCENGASSVGKATAADQGQAQAQAQPQAQPQAPTGTTEPKSNTPTEPASAEPTVKPIVDAAAEDIPAAPSDEAAGPEASTYALNYIPFPEKAVTVNPRRVEWTQIAEPPARLSFLRFLSGVLGRAGRRDEERAYTQGEGEQAGKLIVAEVALPSIYSWFEGRYPKDAWTKRLRSDDSSQTTWELRRLRGNGRWVAQELRNGTVGDDNDEELVAKGWKAGFLLADQDGAELSFHRAARAGVSDPEAVQIYEEGVASEIFETKSGRIYAFVDFVRDGKDHSVVHRACSEPDCERESARAFPAPEGFHSRWNLRRGTPRMRHSFSFSAAEERRSNDQAGGRHGPQGEYHRWVVHYDQRGWTIDQLPGKRYVDFMWPIKDGGMWALVRDEGAFDNSNPNAIALWHMDNEGAWTFANLPEGFTWDKRPEVAIAEVGGEPQIWIAGTRGDKPVVFGASAHAPKPVVDAPVPAPAGPN